MYAKKKLPCAWSSLTEIVNIGNRVFPQQGSFGIWEFLKHALNPLTDSTHKNRNARKILTCRELAIHQRLQTFQTYQEFQEFQATQNR